MPTKYQTSIECTPRSSASSIQASISSLEYTPRPESLAMRGSWLSGESVIDTRAGSLPMRSSTSFGVRWNCSKLTLLIAVSPMRSRNHISRSLLSLFEPAA
ncbi:MAG: hypothetical protein IPG04_16245 [Polyangiaceae bacterium]|nr:hypothetical protein [Polyangiaceae bacterium]